MERFEDCKHIRMYCYSVFPLRIFLGEVVESVSQHQDSFHKTHRVILQQIHIEDEILKLSLLFGKTWICWINTNQPPRRGC